ncbi:MAG TPA: transcription antitermination factor NusB [Steroidobacteraceae bacterium]|jgi:N utilization substance protein B|nr:transcription antitermination factor NusB [Steroidobacteraceae bacterium]
MGDEAAPEPSRERRTHARGAARRLALQALYRWQLNACEWQDLIQEFAAEAQEQRADQDYFRALVSGVCAERERLDAALAPLLDRKPSELDPVEHALLLIGSYELQHRPEVPFRVVLNEAVGLARRFGATDGYKYVNGVLDRAARLWRLEEPR